jgi:hypothetical protein
MMKKWLVDRSLVLHHDAASVKGALRGLDLSAYLSNLVYHLCVRVAVNCIGSK